MEFFGENKTNEAIRNINRRLNDISNIQFKNIIDINLEQMSYPYGLKNWIQNNLLNNRRSRFKKIKNLDINSDLIINKGTQISIRRKYDDKFYNEQSLKIKSGFEYLKYGNISSDLVKPALYYYAINQIYSALIDILLNIKTKKNHGLKLTSIKSEIEINSGFFTKIEILLQLLSNSITPFSNLFFRDSIITSRINFEINKKINIIQLNKSLEEEFKKHESNFFLKTKILLNYLNLFYFCSLSRYNPIEWARILKGFDYHYEIYKRTIKESLKSVVLLLNAIKSRLWSYPQNPTKLFFEKKEKSK